MNFWNKIFAKIGLPSVNIVYMAIGCSMGHYHEITNTNNQQYPCFLNKFQGKKVIILIDPYLEEDLKIQEHLVLVESIIIDNKNIRFFENDNLYVIAINQSFNYELTQWLTPEENQNVQTDISIIYNIIEICLNKIIPTKVILQDYTGRDSTLFYASLLNSFDRNDLLNNILFDVTYNNGGCIVELYETMIQTDISGNFIQNKYLPLINVNDNMQLDKLIKDRIDKLCYPLLFYYSELYTSKIKLSDFNKIFIEQIKLLASIYMVDYDVYHTDNDYVLHVFKQLIYTIIQDIVQIRGLNSEKHTFLLENIHNRSVFIKTIGLLKY